MKLHEFYRQYRELALFCTGDVRSMYMMFGCFAGQIKAKPYFARTPDASEELLDYAMLMAKSFRFTPELIEAENLESAMEKVKARAEQDGYEVLAAGLCTDTEETYINKAEELGCVMPYRLCGLDEREVCRKARNAGFAIGNMWENECHDEHC